MREGHYGEQFHIPEPRKDHRLEKFFALARKGLLFGVLGLTTGDFNAVESRAYVGHASQPAAAETLKEETRKNISEMDIRQMVLKDDAERIIIGDDRELFEVAGGDKDSVFITFDDIQRLVDKGITSPIVGHTHPISAYDNVGYSREEIERMQREAIVPGPMPPSLADVMFDIQTAEHFSAQNVNIRNMVYDPTGRWETRIDPASEAVKLLKRIKFEMDAILNERLTEEEDNKIENSGVGKMHPLRRIMLLKENPETADLGDKIERLINDYLEKLPKTSIQILEKFSDIESSAVNMAGARKAGRSDAEIQKMIDEYIRKADGLGVNVKYQPSK